MQFLSPFMLFGAAAVSIPIGLHFFYRARYKPLPWAPMKFLKEAIEQTSRRLKFQEWILLAIRCLALILLAVALARPGWKTAVVAGRGEAIDAVFIFDTSYSMNADDGENKTRLDRAKDAALQVIETLPAQSSVQIIGCADRAYPLGPVSRFNMDQAKQVVAAIETTALSTDFLPGLSEALVSAKEGTAPAKEVYVFTDMQKSSFERQSGALKAKCEELREIANLIFIRCGKPDRRVGNVAITNVSVALQGEIPHTRSRIPFEITLKNTGKETVKSLKVSIELDGKAVEKDAVAVDQIDPGQVYMVTVTGSLDEPGVRVLKAEATGDDIPGDNVRYKLLLVRDKVRVLIVDGSPHPDNPVEGGDHFVRNALNPARVADYYIEADTVTAAEAGPQNLENKDVVFLLNAPVRDADPLEGMSPEFVARLADFVNGGGGLVISSGDKINPEKYNQALGKGGVKLLPYDIGKVLQTTEESPFTPAPESVAEPSFLAKFRESPYSDVFRFATVNKMLELNETDVSTRTLVRTTEGKALIASKMVGEGEVVMVTSSFDESWGRFPSDGRVFVPFIRFALLNLTGHKLVGGESTTAGNPLVWPSSDPSSVYDLVKPSKNGEKYRERTKIEAPEPEPGQKRIVTAADTLQAGIYHIVPAGRADDSGPIFAVNPDLRETADLTTAQDGDVSGWLGYSPPIIQAGAGTGAAVSQVRSQSEWTIWVLMLLFVMLLAETFWAWFCGRAW